MNSNIKIPNALLSKYTTFQLGGPCDVLIDCQTPAQLINAVRELSTRHEPYILIGGGSNLVVSDTGIQAAVIRFVSQTPQIARHGNKITVSASTILDDLALFSVEEGLKGLNFASGIPGTVGGAIVGNAGAWGEEVGDVLVAATILDKHGQEKKVDRDYCGFSYRHSRLKESQDIVVEATFELTPGDPVALAQERAAILQKRSEKHPNLSTHPCAGSFFRNIEPTSKAQRRQAAGFFLEEAGGKNLTVGGAKIFEKHANIIIKGPQCTAQDVHDLHLKMIDAVKNKFQFELQREVRFVGHFNGAAPINQGLIW